MSDKKSHADTEEQDMFISELYSRTATQQPPEALDEIILAQAHQAVSGNKKKPLSTAWKAALSLAAVMVIGLAVVLEVGIVTHDQGVFEKPGIRQAAEAIKDDMVEEAVAPAGATSTVSPAPAPVPLEREIKLKKQAVPAPQKKVVPSRNEARIEAEIMEQSRVFKRDRTQGLSGGPSHDAMEAPPAEPWLNEIRRLIDQGEQQRAAQELLEFRRHYPGVDVAALEMLLAPLMK